MFFIQMAVNAMSKGALTFLEKPVDPERLNQEVTRAVKLGIRRAEEANELNALKRRYRRQNPLQVFRRLGFDAFRS